MHAEHLNIHIAVLRDQSQEIAFSMETHTFCLLAGLLPPLPTRHLYRNSYNCFRNHHIAKAWGLRQSHTSIRNSAFLKYMSAPPVAILQVSVLCKWKLAYVCKFGCWALPRSMNPLVEARCSAHSFILNSVEQRWQLSWVSGGKEVNLQGYYFVIFFLWIRWNYGLT